MPNLLARETSPYLLQHADNPVDWYPWSEEAFSRARNEDKPILLSIGYSACHWCHVMEQESFQNEATARLMNENFINIKVDREERPDIDHIYMEAVQAMTGSGGWPLTVFLTPDGKPFYGGTYFPPEDKRNYPGFPRILKTAAEAYRDRRSAIENTTRQVIEMLSSVQNHQAEPLAEKYLKQAFMSLNGCFDRKNGGFGGAPKFPHPLTLEFLMRYYTRFNEAPALAMVELTLKRMAAGGIYDQLGGGFHRYATDNEWQYPHFEKMLYDNALLSRVYLHAYQITGKRIYASITEETLNYALREMQSPNGGFYSTQDADSEGEEGKYYLWTQREIREILEENLAEEVENYYEVSLKGNFGRSSILHRRQLQDDPDLIRKARLIMLKMRERRVKPSRDEKILASWNGMMLTSLSEAACTLKSHDYLLAAVSCGRFLLETMVANGKLMHVYKDGQAKIDGFLDDYALVIEGLLYLHQATLNGEWLIPAINLTETMVKTFLDDPKGTFYDTGASNDLIVRPRNEVDGASPSGASAATMVLQKMALIAEERGYQKTAERVLGSIQKTAGEVPLGYSQWLCDLDFNLSVPDLIIIAGPPDSSQIQELSEAVCTSWLPNKVVAAFDPDGPDTIRGLPLLKDKRMINQRPAVYICRNYTCQPPVTDVGELKGILSGSR